LMKLLTFYRVLQLNNLPPSFFQVWLLSWISDQTGARMRRVLWNRQYITPSGLASCHTPRKTKTEMTNNNRSCNFCRENIIQKYGQVRNSRGTKGGIKWLEVSIPYRQVTPIVCPISTSNNRSKMQSKSVC
jgi:hypothetical protein